MCIRWGWVYFRKRKQIEFCVKRAQNWLENVLQIHCKQFSTNFPKKSTSTSLLQHVKKIWKWWNLRNIVQNIFLNFGENHWYEVIAIILKNKLQMCQSYRQKKVFFVMLCIYMYLCTKYYTLAFIKYFYKQFFFDTKFQNKRLFWIVPKLQLELVCSSIFDAMVAWKTCREVQQTGVLEQCSLSSQIY